MDHGQRRSRAQHDDADRDLYDFLVEHELGPCSECPVEAHIADLLEVAR